MARYIDADSLLKKIWYDNSDSIVLRSYAAELVKAMPTADVVPKSEVEKLELTLQGVMWSVDKWLDETDYDADPIKRAIAMREKTLKIVENAKTEVAREIFEEIEKHGRKMQSSDFSGDFWDVAVLMSDIAELKKKYEVQNDG